MRILVISHMYPKPYNLISGNFVHSQMLELLKKGCEIVVVSPVPYVPFPLYHISRKWKRYWQLPLKETREGINIYYPRHIIFPKNILYEHSGKLMFNGIANTVKNIWFNFKFDLIHAQVALPDGFTAVKLKQEYHVPVVVTIHGADLQNTIYRNSRCRQAIGEVLKKADHIITVSDKLKNSAIDNYGYKNKIKTIANGVHPFNINFKKETRINRKIMLSVSNLIQSKGIDLNLIAFSSLIDKHPTLIYKIIGDGPDLLRLKKIVKSLHIPKDRVFFLGQLSNREVLKHMSEADIFSLPSWKEGFGIVYLEAMARGKPVIACKGEGIEDVIEHKVNGFLVEPHDVDSLIRTIDYILANPESAVNIGKIAQQVVLNRYTWEKNAEKIMCVYKNVLGNDLGI